jgi:hypothetical protein
MERDVARLRDEPARPRIAPAAAASIAVISAASRSTPFAFERTGP